MNRSIISTFLIVTSILVAGVGIFLAIFNPFYYASSLGSALIAICIVLMYAGVAIGRSSVNEIHRQVIDWAENSWKRKILFRMVAFFIFGGLALFIFGVIFAKNPGSNIFEIFGLFILAIGFGLGMILRVISTHSP